MVGGGECKNFFEIFSNFFAYFGFPRVQPAFYGVMGDFPGLRPPQRGNFYAVFGLRRPQIRASPRPCRRFGVRQSATGATQ